MNDEVLTVIIPTKNEDTTLLDLLACLENQTFKDFRIIVSDNSVNNRVRQICNEKNLQCIKGGLPGKARNNGVSHTGSKFLLFLDADVSIGNDFVQKALAKLYYNKLDCLSFGFVPKTSNYWLKILHKIAKLYFLVMTNLGNPHGIGGAVLIKRDIHDKIGGFDETITVAEDQDYFKRISVNHKYMFATGIDVHISVRRFITHGILQLSMKYFLIELHRIFIGEIKNDKIPYFERSTLINE